MRSRYETVHDHSNVVGIVTPFWAERNGRRNLLCCDEATRKSASASASVSANPRIGPLYTQDVIAVLQSVQLTCGALGVLRVHVADERKTTTLLRVVVYRKDCILHVPERMKQRRYILSSHVVTQVQHT